MFHNFNFLIALQCLVIDHISNDTYFPGQPAWLINNVCQQLYNEMLAGLTLSPQSAQ